MYFACCVGWHFQHHQAKQTYHKAIDWTDKKASRHSKNPQYLMLHVWSPGLVYYDCMAALVVTGRSWRVMQQPEPGRDLQPERRGGHGRWSPGCGHFGWREGGRWDVTSSLIIHYGADTRSGHISHLQSPHHVTKDWAWQSRGEGGTNGGRAWVRHHRVQEFRDRTQRSNNLPKGQPDISIISFDKCFSHTKGSFIRDENARPQPNGAGHHGPLQHSSQKWTYLLPRLLRYSL